MKKYRPRQPISRTIVRDGVEEEIIFDIRQQRFFESYLNPKSKFYGNAYKSALEAGYKETYAHSITTRRFFMEKMRRLSFLPKAEKVIDKTLSMDTTGLDGREQADLLRIQNDTAKFIAKTLGKDEGYSERSELSGAGGQPLVFIPQELMDRYGLEENKQD